MEQTQINLEKLYAKNQIIPRVKQEFINAGFSKHLEDDGIDVKFGLSVLTQIALHKRANFPTMLGLTKHHFDSLQDCSDALLDMAQKNYLTWSKQNAQFVVRFGIDAETQMEIDTYQYPLPMLVEPREVTNNRETGYFTIPGSMILKNNHHDDDICLDVINDLNKIKFSVNTQVVQHINNNWKNIDKQKDGEDYSTYKQRVENFKKYTNTAKDILEAIYINGNTFHLTHKYDKRGRIYSMGYHCTYQGNTWNKATIQFSDMEYVQ